MRALFEHNNRFFIIDEEKRTSGPTDFSEMITEPGDWVCPSSDITGMINIKKIDRKDLYATISSSNRFITLYSDRIIYTHGDTYTAKNHPLEDTIDDLYEYAYSESDHSDLSTAVEEYGRYKDDLYDISIKIGSKEYKCSEIYGVFETIADLIKTITDNTPISENVIFCNVLCKFSIFKSLLPNNIVPKTPFEMAEKLLDYVKNQND